MYLGKRKNGNYFIEFYDEVESRIRRITTKTKIRKEAIKFLSDFSQNIQNKKSTSEIITLEKFWDQYVEYIGNTHSKNYLRSINLAFSHLLRFSGESKLISKITIREIQQFLSIANRRSEYASHLYLRTLKASFNVAIDWGYIADNPFVKIKLPKLHKGTPKFIGESELEKIITNTEKPIFKKIFRFAFFTGMRLGEITNLKWDSVDLKSQIILVTNSNLFNTKSKKDRVIPIHRKIHSILIKKVSNNIDDYVFSKMKDIKFNNDFVSKSFKKAVRKATLDDRIHFHTLRHSFASNLVQKGVSIYVVKELLGHEDISTTQIYSHLQTDNLLKAIDLL